ncbi:MAG TPA: amidohydrolase family protein [Verrucomicrobiae bacterium]|nr:amidohydrolase family protein [Verrucomicrobiae bacterium]
MSAQLLRARIVWPVTQPPIENGGVYIRDGLIQYVGTWADLSRRWSGEPTEDLGEVALMPGLVNAHCHLDYTGMAGMIPPPSSSLNFPDWIKSILSLKAHWSYTEFAASWVKGAKQLLESGCTTVFDIEAVPELLPEGWDATPLRVVSFLEMTGVRSGHEPERILHDATHEMSRWGAHTRSKPALSPHALYSTPPELLKLVAEKMRTEKIPVSIHLAESEAEWEMYQNAHGPLYDWLKSQRPMTDCGGKSPVQRAHELGLLQPNLLAIHCNYLAPGDAELLANSSVTVVHCPRSHAFFKHAPFPFEELRNAGVNVVLGTDSLASMATEKGSVPTLNMWSEIEQFSETYASVSPRTAALMAMPQRDIFAGGLVAYDWHGRAASNSLFELGQAKIVRVIA